MTVTRSRSFLAATITLGVFGCVSAVVTAARQTATVSTPSLSPERMEEFLLKGRIESTRDTGVGVTNSIRARMTYGDVTHDVHIQSVNESRAVFEAGPHSEVGFKDTYRFNIAGYRLARLLGITTVPMSVERTYNGKPAAFTWWVDDVQMDEKQRTAKKTLGPNPGRASNQLQVMRVWDELIQNRDRNQGNILWTSDWTMWLIDHTRAFRLGKELLKTSDLNRCDRGLLERLKGLTDTAVAEAVGESLTREERQAVLARRDRLVKHFQDRIAKFGEAVVLFDLPL
jgi:hypothetical protein